MAAIDVEITRDKFPQLIARFPSAVRKRARAQVEETEREVRANIVAFGLIDTGLMLTTVVGTMTDRAEGMVAVPAVSPEGFPYPVVQDKGSVHVPATGFFSKAVDKARSAFPRKFDGIERDIV